MLLLLVGALLAASVGGRLTGEPLTASRQLATSCALGQACVDAGQPENYCAKIPGENAGICLDLDDGEQANLDGFGEENCPVGKYADIADPNWATLSPDYRCLPCPVGTYEDEEGEDQCDCPAPGNFPLVAATGPLPRLFVGQQGCLKGEHNSKLAECPDTCAGTECGSGECSQCDPGSFSPIRGLRDCLPCGRGHYVNTPGFKGIECTDATEVDCEDYDENDPDSAQKHWDCNQCVPGKFQDELGQATCKTCQAGGYEDLSASIGKALDSEVTERLGLPAGSKGCTCASKGHTASADHTTEEECGPGSYAAEVCSSECSLCEPGRTSNEAVADGCDLCGNGTAQPLSGQTEDNCPLCVPGKYADREGMTGCLACGPGRWADDFGETDCDCAPQGHYPNDNRTGYLTCAIGSYNNEICSVGCTLCERGKTSDDPGALQCDECALGSAQSSRGAFTNNCPLCDPGKYSDKEGLEECKTCALDEFTVEKGRTSCDSCWTLDAGFGFAHAQCTATWLILGGVAALITASVGMKLGKAYRGACCKDGRCLPEGCLLDFFKYCFCGVCLVATMLIFKKKQIDETQDEVDAAQEHVAGGSNNDNDDSTNGVQLSTQMSPGYSPAFAFASRTRTNPEAFALLKDQTQRIDSTISNS